MRVRQRIFNELILRLNTELVSDVDPISWNEDTLICLFDELNVHAMDTVKSEWHYVLHQEGILKTRFHLSRGSANLANFDPLLNSLVNEPILLMFDANVGFGENTEKAHAQLKTMRETAAGDTVLYELIFAVDAYIATKITRSEVPKVWFGVAPDIGPSHLEDYKKLY